MFRRTNIRPVKKGLKKTEKKKTAIELQTSHAQASWQRFQVSKNVDCRRKLGYAAPVSGVGHNIVLHVDNDNRFYTALFSALEQTHYPSVACDSK